MHIKQTKFEVKHEVKWKYKKQRFLYSKKISLTLNINKILSLL